MIATLAAPVHVCAGGLPPTICALLRRPPSGFAQSDASAASVIVYVTVYVHVS